MTEQAKQSTGAADAPGIEAPQVRTYTAPAMERRVQGWPFGRFKRCEAVFKIEQHPTRGERAVRVITDEEGRSYAPKKLTYAARVRIVEGSDGRTYIAELTRSGFVSIMQGDMKYQAESIFAESPRFAEVRALFEDDGGLIRAFSAVYNAGGPANE
jgi:hypothetical protein